MRYKKFKNRKFRHFASIPVIWGMAPALVAFDLCIEIYHRICFPLYGIDYVERTRYIKIDRHRLPYLKWYDKFNCIYCGYANGLMHFSSTIIAETEKYWCGIKHNEDKQFIPPSHHKNFIEYGDKTSFEKLCKIGNKKGK